MARHIWSALCSRFILDKGTDLMSLIDVTEELRVVSPKTMHPDPSGTVWLQIPNLVLVSVWRRSEEQTREAASMHISIRTPIQPQVQLVRDLPLDLESAIQCRVVLSIFAIPHHGQGTYEVSIYSDPQGDVAVASLPFDLKLLTSEATSPEPPSERTPGAPRE